MIEHYVNQIIDMDILADSITIIDEKGIIQYYKVFRKDASPFLSSEMVGRHFLDVFTNIDPNESTVLKALSGEATINNNYSVIAPGGISYNILESVYPVRLENKIIGAVCVSQNTTNYKKYLDIKTHQNSLNSKLTIDNIIGDSPKIHHLKMQITELAKTDANILIYGETGTGKEMVAEAIHNLSLRCDKIFYSQNCAAIPEGLAESLFFGTKKGIYTGSVDSAGILEQADGGTLFFDEVNSLNYSIQGKLLRTLETKKVHRLGSDKEKSIDFRIIAATNEDPFKCVESGKLRSDLFYRLSTIILEVPPLRNRKDDIPILTNHFIQLHNNSSQKQFSGVSDDVMNIFLDYSWPGNVRELRNVIESSIIFAKSSTIQECDIPLYITKKTFSSVKAGKPINSLQNTETHHTNDFMENIIQNNSSYKSAMECMEKCYLETYIKKNNNQTKLAKDLGISRQSLINKLNKYNLR